MNAFQICGAYPAAWRDQKKKNTEAIAKFA